jgi:hypothetical protein
MRFTLPWIPAWGANIALGVDGLSLVMIAMTGLLMPLAVLGSWRNVGERPVSYHALLLVLTAGTMGVFLALDLLLFYVSWELVLIPMYFMIGVSGGEGRQRASLQYFLIATLGSLLMLVAIVALWSAAGGTPSTSTSSPRGARHAVDGAQIWMFLGFFIALAVKSAFFPVHSWLPGAQKAGADERRRGARHQGRHVRDAALRAPALPGGGAPPVMRTTLVGLASPASSTARSSPRSARPAPHRLVRRRSATSASWCWASSRSPPRACRARCSSW